MDLAPLLPREALDRLRSALLRVDYTTDAVLERIGEAGQAGLGRNVTLPADLALQTGDALDDLIRLWLLQQPVGLSRLAELLPLPEMLDAGILITQRGRLRAGIDIRPYGSPDDGASGWLVSDLTPGLDHAPVRLRPDYVLGASPASTTLAQITSRRPVASALDLGTGCGIQSLHLAQHAERVTATDLNPRALQLAALGVALNGLDIDLRLGSLYEPVVDQRFDLIVTNPPYVMSPPGGERLVYREGTFTGDGLVAEVVRGARDHLTSGGMLQVLGNWAIKSHKPWQDRLASWAAEDCDLWVIERERLDRHEYIEMWLTDAGVHQTPGWERAYRTWLDYFDQLGITAVGMGWITLVRLSLIHI